LNKENYSLHDDGWIILQAISEDESKKEMLNKGVICKRKGPEIKSSRNLLLSACVAGM